MKRVLAVLLTSVLVFNGFIVHAAAESKPAAPVAPQIGAESCILIDAATSTVLYEKNADKKQYPASTTKVMTAALTIELGYMGKTTTVSRNAVKSIGINGSNVGLKAGEIVKIDDLLNMALISSANDAANALAEGVSGSIASFVTLMNSKARLLGLKNTTFANPVGLDVEDKFPNHMSTARELAQVMRYATSMEALRTTAGKSRYTLPITNFHRKSRGSQTSTNKLLTDPGYKTDLYTVVGGKTGWTKAAKNVFVACARNGDGIELIMVMMKHPSRNTMFQDAKKLFDYGFQVIESNPELGKSSFYDIRMRGSKPIIDSFYQNGYITGSSDGKFNYAEPVTRELFLEVLARVRGNALEGEEPKACFERAYTEGLIDETWLYEKEKLITRGEVISIMDKLLNTDLEDSEIPVFIELIKDYDSIPEHLRASVLRIYKTGIVKGCGDGTVRIEKELTKEEMVYLLNNYIHYKNQKVSLFRIVRANALGCSQVVCLENPA